MAINFTTLFTTLGRIFADQESVNTFRGDTASFDAIIDQFDGEQIELRRAIANYFSADKSRQSSLNSSLSATRQVAQTYLIEFVYADVELQTKSVRNALVELITQMDGASETVSKNTVSASVTAQSGATEFMIITTKTAFGNDSEHIYDEDIEFQCTSGSKPASSWLAVGPGIIADQLSSDWPRGRTDGFTITAATPSSSLLSNSSFDEEAVTANVPDDWFVVVGTPGTTIKMSDYEVQAVAITGTPTTGSYRLAWANTTGDVVWTDLLNFDATGADVQAALRAIRGLESVTVDTTGTGPNYTHTITFIEQPGNASQVTAPVNTTGATITISTTTSGSTNAIIGRSMEFDSDGSELTAIYQKVSLSPMTQYGFCVRMKTDSVPAAGVIKIDLVGGIDNSATADASGNANEITINANSLTTSWVAKTGFFRTAATLPDNLYLRIRISTAVSNTSSIFFDEAILVQATELYAMGPSVTLFGGYGTDLSVVTTLPGFGTTSSKIQVSVNNNYNGEFQQCFERNFGLRELRLQLPTDASPTISDSLIA